MANFKPPLWHLDPGSELLVTNFMADEAGEIEEIEPSFSRDLEKPEVITEAVESEFRANADLYLGEFRVLQNTPVTASLEELKTDKTCQVPFSLNKYSLLLNVKFNPSLNLIGEVLRAECIRS